MKCAAGDLLELSIAGAMGLLGCETKREPLGRAACPTWKQSVAELPDRRCVACHGSDRAEGAYPLDGYVEAFGVGTDTPTSMRGPKTPRSSRSSMPTMCTVRFVRARSRPWTDGLWTVPRSSP